MGFGREKYYTELSRELFSPTPQKMCLLMERRIQLLLLGPAMDQYSVFASDWLRRLGTYVFFHLTGLELWWERIVYGTMENTNERFSWRKEKK